MKFTSFLLVALVVTVATSNVDAWTRKKSNRVQMLANKMRMLSGNRAAVTTDDMPSFVPIERKQPPIMNLTTQRMDTVKPLETGSFFLQNEATTPAPIMPAVMPAVMPVMQTMPHKMQIQQVQQPQMVMQPMQQQIKTQQQQMQLQPMQMHQQQKTQMVKNFNNEMPVVAINQRPQQPKAIEQSPVPAPMTKTNSNTKTNFENMNNFDQQKFINEWTRKQQQQQIFTPTTTTTTLSQWQQQMIQNKIINDQWNLQQQQPKNTTPNPFWMQQQQQHMTIPTTTTSTTTTSTTTTPVMPSKPTMQDQWRMQQQQPNPQQLWNFKKPEAKTTTETMKMSAKDWASEFWKKNSQQSTPTPVFANQWNQQQQQQMTTTTVAPFMNQWNQQQQQQMTTTTVAPFMNQWNQQQQQMTATQAPIMNQWNQKPLVKAQWNKQQPQQFQPQQKPVVNQWAAKNQMQVTQLMNTTTVAPFKSAPAEICQGMEAGDILPNPSNQAQFVICYGYGEYTVMDCPDHLVYNPHLVRCDLEIEEPIGCASNPCLNDAKCIDLPQLFTFTCECQVGFTGQMCEKMDACASSPCGQDGVCMSMASGSPVPHACLCNSGRTIGSSCQQQDIEMNPCLQPKSNLDKFPTRLSPSVFVFCEGLRPHFVFCQFPLVYNPTKQECDWSN